MCLIEFYLFIDLHFNILKIFLSVFISTERQSVFQESLLCFSCQVFLYLTIYPEVTLIFDNTGFL